MEKDLLSQFISQVNAVPPGDSIVPLLKAVLLAGPDSHVDPATRASVQAWDEPFPTIPQVVATTRIYDVSPVRCPKLADLLRLITASLAIRTLLESMK